MTERTARAKTRARKARAEATANSLRDDKSKMGLAILARPIFYKLTGYA
jgi:hypothetical protein